MILNHFSKIERHIQTRSRISLKKVFMDIEGDSILIAITLLSIFNIILAPLPVNSFILGIPLILLSFAYLCKIDLVQKNYKWMRRPMKCVKWRPYLQHAKPIFVKIDKNISSRYHIFAGKNFSKLSAFALLFLALVIFLPIPFANIPGSIGMLIISTGIIQKDGLFIALGHMIAIGHVVAIIILATLIDSLSFI